MKRRILALIKKYKHNLNTVNNSTYKEEAIKSGYTALNKTIIIDLEVLLLSLRDMLILKR